MSKVKSCPHPHVTKCCLRCGTCDCVFLNEDTSSSYYKSREYNWLDGNGGEANRNAFRILANKYQASSHTTTHLYGSKLHPRYTSSTASSISSVSTESGLIQVDAFKLDQKGVNNFSVFLLNFKIYVLWEN